MKNLANTALFTSVNRKRKTFTLTDALCLLLLLIVIVPLVRKPQPFRLPPIFRSSGGSS